MYESVIWVGFGAVFFSFIFELIYRKRYFMMCGAAAGFFCLILMDLLPAISGNSDMPGFGSKISPLQPVLQSNFWLTVHVLTITLSYAAFMLTWVLGHVTLARHLFDPGAKEAHRELHLFVYRAMQVGVLLIACGTILGGVWAYYSWGRFWGWDPKETWAFITLMCYLVVLHGRFTGWWGNFGLSVGSVVCFQSVVMAWYGVNFILGSGLHAYGSGAGGLEYVGSAVALDAVFTGAAIYQYMTYRSGQDSGEAGNKLTDTDPITDARSAGAGE
jgi:ABC-type transport system involved in cytochrome c biogenesis permease subunit